MMKLHRGITIAGNIALLIMLAKTAQAATFNESLDGDLSGDRLNPSHVLLSAGSNSIIANTGIIIADDIAYDQEYLRVDLPINHQLQSILLRAYDSVDGTAFIGVQAGTTFTFDPDDAVANIGNLLGYAHFGPNEGHSPGHDILAELGNKPGTIGFSPPLSDSSYTFWIQRTGAPTNWQLDFVVSAIPEPTSILILLSTGLAFGFVRVRRNN